MRNFLKISYRDDFLNIVFNNEIIVRGTINLIIKIYCNHFLPPMFDLFFEVRFSTEPRDLCTKQLIFFLIGFENDEMLSQVNSSIIRPFKRLAFDNEFNLFEISDEDI